ncbi:hypothetical protein ACWC10_11080 [Streptomyces sp. NPDC001595]|uniref:hypothetical protein n=1 Tax=Streptomyces sp. NPDC001532 TaxID=3154520 RepID=UPI003328B951
MRERPDVVQESSAGEEVRRKRIDLSVPQVAGSAVAAVVAAKLASYFGVYGTILGAGLVSAVATCGGSLFQHFFKRTGEQLRDATVAARPREARERVPVAEQAPPVPGEFTEGTVYRARVRGRRRPVLAAALVFGVTMTGITAYELVSGSSFSGGRSTTVGDALSGRAKSPSHSTDPDDSGDSGDSGRSQEPGGSGGTQDSDGSASSAPSADAPQDEDATTPSDAVPGGGDSGEADSPAPSASPEATDGDTDPPTPPGASATPPAPSASSRSGTAVPDQDGPAAR